MHTLALLLLLACGSTPSGDGDDTDSGTHTATTDSTPTACASQADCPADLICQGPNEPQACGIGPMEECAVPEDCADDNRCHTVIDSCSPDGFGSECAPACTPESCGEDFICDAGACRAIPCAVQADICPPWQTCDPTSLPIETPIYDQHHGCVDITCTIDDDCPTVLFCVNATCQESPGECVVFQSVP